MVVRDRIIRIVVAQINRDHAYIERGNDVCIVTKTYDHEGTLDLKFRTRKSLTELYDSKLVRLPKINQKSVTFEYKNPISIWSKHSNRRNLRGLVNAPGVELSNEWLNVWSGWGAEPLLKNGTPDYSGEKCQKIIRHIVDIWCNRDEVVAKWVLAWFADILQNPTRKPDTAIMAYSGQGTGKSFVVEHVLSKILGSGYGYEDNPEFLNARFNKRVAGKLLIYSDEAFFHGDKGSADRLKAFISKKVITIEEKGKDSYETKHHARIVATTNRDHALSIDNDDRRWLILEVNEDRKKDYQYFSDLEAEIEAGGVEAFYSFLLNPELLLGINLRETPETTALLKQKLQSLNPDEAFIYECLYAGTVQLEFNDEMRQVWSDKGEQVGKADFHKSYLEFCKKMGDKFPKRDSQFSETIKKIFDGIKDGRSGNANRHWKLPPLHEARAQFAIWLASSPERKFEQILWGDSPSFENDVSVTSTNMDSLSAQYDDDIPF